MAEMERSSEATAPGEGPGGSGEDQVARGLTEAPELRDWVEIDCEPVMPDDFTFEIDGRTLTKSELSR